MTVITIQSANAKTNFDAIRKVYWQTWMTTYRGLVPSAVLNQLTPAVWHPEKRWRNTQLALNEEGEIIGVCSYDPARLAQFADWGELYSIYILPAYQHQGVGQRLMAQALSTLRQKYQHLYLEVLVTNIDAQHFYTRLGFCRTTMTHSSHVSDGKLKTIIFASNQNKMS